MTRYAICKAIDLDQATMTRFMQGKGGLSMKVLDDLADVLGIAAVSRKTLPMKKRRK